MRRQIQFTRDLAPSSRSDTLIDFSMTELLSRLRKKTLTSSALVEAHIERLQVTNGALNALIADRFAEARAEARAADEKAATTAADALPPLHGIPCTVKEFFGVKGMPQTTGLVCKSGGRAETDSTATSRLRKAGAIILGVSNVPEGGLWMETYNKLYGRTKNPWHLEHTSGGSSGGEGAIVSSGGAVFGLGSDIGGSVRIPAAFCGTVGHKPSGGLLPLTGHTPGPLGNSQLLVAGPLCRRVEDVMPLLRVLAGPDGIDTTCEALPLGDPADVKLDHVRVFSLPGPGPLRISEVMQAAVEASVMALHERGASVFGLEPGLLRGGFAMWMAAMQDAAPYEYAEILSGGAGIDVGREFLRLPLGRSRYILPSLVTVLAQRVMRRLPRALNDSSGHLDRLARLRSTLDELLGDDGVIIYPPYTRPAPRHHRSLLTPFDPACTALWNVLGYPSTVVPLGFAENGLPVAVQVLARRGHDHLTLAVAAALEQRFGGWVRSEPPAVAAA